MSFLSFFFDEKSFSCQMDQKQNHFCFRRKNHFASPPPPWIINYNHPATCSSNRSQGCTILFLYLDCVLCMLYPPTPILCLFDVSFQMDFEKARCMKLLTASMMLGVIGRQYPLLLFFVFNLSVKLLSLLDCPIMPEGASSTNLQPKKHTKKFRMVP